jgi:hypothetical protein
VRSSLSDTSEASLIKFSNFVAVVPAHANTDRRAARVAGGVDMSFWIWVGVAIVVVLVVAFVRDRRRAASRRGDKGGDAERRLEGRDVERDPHEGEFWGGGSGVG